MSGHVAVTCRVCMGLLINFRIKGNCCSKPKNREADTGNRLSIVWMYIIYIASLPRRLSNVGRELATGRGSVESLVNGVSPSASGRECLASSASVFILKGIGPHLCEKLHSARTP